MFLESTSPVVISAIYLPASAGSSQVSLQKTLPKFRTVHLWVVTFSCKFHISASIIISSFFCGCRIFALWQCNFPVFRNSFDTYLCISSSAMQWRNTQMEATFLTLVFPRQQQLITRSDWELELGGTILHLMLPSGKGPLQCKCPSCSWVVTVWAAAATPVFRGGGKRCISFSSATKGL